MTWYLAGVSTSSQVVAAPSPATEFKKDDQATVFVDGLGSITLYGVGEKPGGPHQRAVRVTSGDYEEYWYFDDDGKCELTIKPDGSFELTGLGQTLAAPIGGVKGTLLELPTDCKTYLNACTNAGYIQRATATVHGGGKTMVWTGKGEGNNQIANTDFTTPPFAPGNGRVPFMVGIEYSSDGGKSWHPSKVALTGEQTATRYVQHTIISEDWKDEDWNDCVVVVSWWEKPKE